MLDPWYIRKRDSFLLPPPNITGNLHLGHAYCFHLCYFNCSLSQSKSIYGCDHAGIMAQTRIDPTRSMQENVLLAKLYHLADQSSIRFKEQYALWGIDFNDEHFSLNAKFNSCVLDAFKRLDQLGFIQRRGGLVNIETQEGKILSDAELKPNTEMVLIYYIKYISIDGNVVLNVATTRPETIFNDVAICCHPNDIRYIQYIGQYFTVPLSGHNVPLKTSKAVKMDFGTGLLKITPRYDARDLLISQNLNLGLGFDFMDDNMTSTVIIFPAYKYTRFTTGVIMLLQKLNRLLIFSYL